MIGIEGLTKSFGTTRVLNGIDHRQAASETVVLIGPSGCGKSTFLRCLNQLETPDTGRIRIGDLTLEGGRLPTTEQQRQLRLRAGMVFQHFHLFPHRTALENVMEGPRYILGETRAQAEAKARELLGKVGTGRPRRPSPGPALRRPTAARGHRPRTGHASAGVADG